MSNDYKKFRTRSGLNYVLSEQLYETLINNDPQCVTLYLFEQSLIAGEFFSKVNRYIAIIFLLFSGYTGLLHIFLASLIVGLLSNFIWYHSSLYKLQAVSFIYMFMGQIVFRFFIHIIALACLAILVFQDWKIILYCVLAGIVCNVLETWFSGYKQTANHNNKAALFFINKYK